jgi:hypothetical protein
MIARSLLVSLLALPLFGLGCHKATVEVYRVPKEKDPEFPMANAAAASTNSGGTAMPAQAPSAGAGATIANTAVPTAEGAGLTWSAPADWKPKEASAMRKGSYSVPGPGGVTGDLSITAFPGDVGGELANVNRWRGQVHLSPISEAELPANVTREEHDGLQFAIVDFAETGPNPQRILGAIIPYNGATWFFKLAGPDAVVAGAKPGFLAFLQTVKPASPAP